MILICFSIQFVMDDEVIIVGKDKTRFNELLTARSFGAFSVD